MITYTVDKNVQISKIIDIILSFDRGGKQTSNEYGINKYVK